MKVDDYIGRFTRFRCDSKAWVFNPSECHAYTVNELLEIAENLKKLNSKMSEFHVVNPS